MAGDDRANVPQNDAALREFDALGRQDVDRYQACCAGIGGKTHRDAAPTGFAELRSVEQNVFIYLIAQGNAERVRRFRRLAGRTRFRSCREAAGCRRLHRRRVRRFQTRTSGERNFDSLRP